MVRLARSTKGVSISINMVVVAVIALVVLAICVYIVLDKSGAFQAGTSNCEGVNMGCFADSCGTGLASEFPLRNYAATCSAGQGGETRICCMHV